MGLEHAQITNLVSCEKIPVLFNPEEYTLAKDINYAQSSVPGLSGPILQFVNGNLQTLEMELLVDTYEKHGEGSSSTAAGADVRGLTGKITGLMAIDPTTHAPPVLLFSWGSLYFKCVLARVTQRFIMFRPDGIPVRARLNVTFNEYLEPAREAKEVSRQTADYTKEHVVLDGETLSAVAARLYEDPRLWRPIALRNRIADPRSILPGQRLLVPSLPFTDPSTGEVIG
jgi:hypothetical protein